MGRNKLRVLPPQLSKLTFLKILSVQKNRIQNLPLCLASMESLQVLKVDGNPIQGLRPLNNGGTLNETRADEMVDEVALTSRIKRYLRQISEEPVSGIEASRSDGSSIIPETSPDLIRQGHQTQKFPVDYPIKTKIANKISEQEVRQLLQRFRRHSGTTVHNHTEDFKVPRIPDNTKILSHLGSRSSTNRARARARARSWTNSRKQLALLVALPLNRVAKVVR